MGWYPGRLGLIFDGIFDGTEIRGVQKTPWKTAPSGDDVNPSLPPTKFFAFQALGFLPPSVVADLLPDLQLRVAFSLERSIG